MGKNLIVTGWNRALYEKPDDLELFYRICFDEFCRRVKNKPLRKKAVGIIPTRLKLKRLMRSQSDGEINQTKNFKEAIESLNNNVINGTPVERIRLSTIRHAQPGSGELNYSGFNLESLNALLGCRRNYMIAIVSSAYDGGIKANLDRSGFKKYFDFIIGSKLEEQDGIATGIHLRCYDDKSCLKNELIDKDGGVRYNNIIW
jgi:hypothetical protein